MKQTYINTAIFLVAMTFAVSNVAAQIPINFSGIKKITKPVVTTNTDANIDAINDPTTRTNPTTGYGEANDSGSAEVRAQAPKRIEFGKGKNSATVRGTTGQNGATYLIRARSGQMLVLTLDPRSGVGIKVETTGRFGHMVLLREERGGTYEIGLEENGEYTIFVGSTSGKSAAFTLGVRITRMTDI